VVAAVPLLNWERTVRRGNTAIAVVDCVSGLRRRCIGGRWGRFRWIEGKWWDFGEADRGDVKGFG
jgi:hypothetical protein